MKSLPTVLRNTIDKTITLSCENPSYSLIWLHGLGDTSEGFYSYFTHPLSPLYSSARIRLLQAPDRQMTLYNEKCPSWYDIKQSDRTLQQSKVYSKQDINESVETVGKYVQEEVEHWEQHPSKVFPYHRVFVGGFSQGCAIALRYGMQCQKPIAGIVGFSGFLFRSTQLSNLGKTNVLLNHGEADPVVNSDHSKKSYQGLLDDPKVQYRSIPGQEHTVSLQQLKNMSIWLKKTNSEISQFYNTQQ